LAGPLPAPFEESPLGQIMNPDASFRLLACKYLRKQTNALLKQIGGIRKNEDIECVHQARVASRRIDAALTMFDICFSSKKVRRWRRAVRRLIEGLGAARNRDVQIAFVTEVVAEVAGGDDEKHPGAERLLLRLKQQREALQPGVLDEVDRLESSPALAAMYAEAERERWSLSNAGTPLRSAPAIRHCGREIRSRLKKLLKLEAALDDVEVVPPHHQMRIAVKRLRYTMEICSPMFDKRLDDAIEVARKLQSLLGEIRDCDVWAGTIETFIEDEHRRTVEYFGHDRDFGSLRPGLEYLKRERAAHRQAVFDELVAFWKATRDRGVWPGLRDRLKAGTSGPPDVAGHEAAKGSGRRSAEPRDTARGRTTDKPMEAELPGTFYQRGSRWWWRVQLPSENKPRSRALRPARSRATTTDWKVAIEVASEMWQVASQGPAAAQPPTETAGDAGESAAMSREVVKADSATERADEPRAQEQGSVRSPVLAGPADTAPPPAGMAICECCGKNHLLASDVSRIDSGQLLCTDCLAELRRTARGG